VSSASGTTPLQVADRVAARADAALGALKSLAALEVKPPAALGRRRDELRKTLGDIRAMALLGKYYSAKIRGATELALFRANAGTQHRERAIQSLTDAARSWRAYMRQASSQYRNPVWTNRVGIVDWAELTAEVDNDIAIARQPAKPPQP
jgi:hypothetical protein